ncbi:hypothetical protein PFISCL1PPCAC_26682, partial [Pristionchus fissidentatus]
KNRSRSCTQFHSCHPPFLHRMRWENTLAGHRREERKRRQQSGCCRWRCPLCARMQDRRCRSRDQMDTPYCVRILQRTSKRRSRSRVRRIHQSENRRSSRRERQER